MDDNIHNVEMWIGGKFVEQGSKSTYEGGHKNVFVDVDLDTFNLDDITEMYVKSGGKRTIVNYYFKRSGVTLEIGLRTTNMHLPDLSIDEMAVAYESIINSPEEIEMRLLMSGIDFNDEYEENATQKFMEASKEQSEGDNEQTKVDLRQVSGIGEQLGGPGIDVGEGKNIAYSVGLEASGMGINEVSGAYYEQSGLNETRWWYYYGDDGVVDGRGLVAMALS
ncbi:hypothetical protein BUALT_Bualt11G0085100 [Buddleja alternifolia]|uniref:PB1-like domain-containing protein n=1 Tax=Buddleja alternifolia TaxID=168488 RepID=A0AAV6X201_9LAMI|nr:hypothetical protein BUALT_Bualt11G0085100 [Buddleja alternifolia]